MTKTIDDIIFMTYFGTYDVIDFYYIIYYYFFRIVLFEKCKDLKMIKMVSKLIIWPPTGR